jgi:hypothetical protein
MLLLVSLEVASQRILITRLTDSTVSASSLPVGLWPSLGKGQMKRETTELVSPLTPATCTSYPILVAQLMLYFM